MSAHYVWDIVVEQCPLSADELLDLDLKIGDRHSFRTGPMTQADLFTLIDDVLSRGCTLASVHRRES